jgi:hypothetical protein
MKLRSPISLAALMFALATAPAMALTPPPVIVATAVASNLGDSIHVPVGTSVFFLVKATNSGGTAPVTVTANTGRATLPITMFMCQVKMVSGQPEQCLDPIPSESLTGSFPAAANEDFYVAVSVRLGSFRVD